MIPRPRKPSSPFRHFNSSPEIIRLALMMECGSRCHFAMSKTSCSNVASTSVSKFWGFGGTGSGQCLQAAARGVRHWCWHLDEMYVKLNGEMAYLWRAHWRSGVPSLPELSPILRKLRHLETSRS